VDAFANLFDKRNSRTRHDVPQRHVETVVKNTVDIAGKHSPVWRRKPLKTA
jgi:hypothetical protein